MKLARVLARALASCVLVALPALPHEARPVSLGIVERVAGEYQVELRVPESIEAFNRPVVRWPEGCLEPSAGQLHCSRALTGQSLRLEWPMYNPAVTTLARYTSRDGFTRTAVLPPEEPAWKVPADPSAGDVMRGYFVLGVEDRKSVV